MLSRTYIGLLSIGFLLFGGILTVEGQTPPRNNPYAPNKFQYEFLGTGAHHSVALRCDGTIRTWGSNDEGQLGNNNAGTDEPTPVDPGVSNVVSVAAGANHTVILKKDCTVWAAGNNGSGQLGDGTTTNRDQFVQVMDGGGNPLDSIVAIGAGTKHTVALKSDNTLYAWGDDTFGQLGNGASGGTNTPMEMQGVDTTVIQIACGLGDTYILQADGTVKSVGADQHGQLGDDNASSKSEVFVYVQGLGPSSSDFVEGIAGGGAHALAVLADGTIKGWGKNGVSQLSGGCGGNSCNTPVDVTGISTAEAVAAGSGHSLALLEDSTVMAWGQNTSGQCGQGNTASPIDPPQAVTSYGGTPYAISAPLTTPSSPMGSAPDQGFGNHSLALIDLPNMDSLESMGQDGEGQLGDDATLQQKTSPVRVTDYTLGLLDADAGNDTTACGGDSVTIGPDNADTSKFTYSWTPTIGMNDSTIPNPKVALSPSTSVTVSYILTKTYDSGFSLSACIKRDTVKVTFNAGVQADLAHNGPKCEGEEVDFENTGSSSAIYDYQWDFGSGATPATSTQNDPPLVTYSGFGVKQIQLTVFDSVCNDTVSTVEGLTIHEEPTAGFNSSAPACEQAPVSFFNMGSTGSKWTYSWSFGSGSSPNTSNAEDPSGITYSSSGTKTVSQTITDDNGHCAATATQTIGIQGRPNAVFEHTGPACTGEPVDFTNTGSSGGSYSYSWDLGSNATPSNSSMENPSGVTYASSGIRQVVLVIENTSTGCRDTVQKDLTIHQSPTVAFSSSAPVCAGEPVSFTNMGSSGSQWSYQWDFGEGASPNTSTAEEPSGIAYGSGGTPTVTLTVNSSHCQRTDSMEITIDSFPQADAGDDTTICADESATIGSPADAGNSYLWSPSGTLDDAFAAQPTASPIAEFTTYYLRVQDSATGCVARDSVTVTMLTSGLVNAGPDVRICKGDSVQLGKGLIEGQNYDWDPDSGLNAPSSPHPQAYPDSTTLYTLKVSRHGCDTLTDQVEVTVDPLPDAEAGPDVKLVRGERTKLTASGGVSYKWSPDSALSDDMLSDPYASPDSTTLYRVLVTDVRGCRNSDSVLVKVITPERFVPTAFTPDGDGHNDVFRVRGPDLEDFRMEIFDRSGERIFMTEDYQEGWDGRILPEGKEAPQGAYPYVIRGKDENGEMVRIKGMVNLLR